MSETKLIKITLVLIAELLICSKYYMLKKYNILNTFIRDKCLFNGGYISQVSIILAAIQLHMHNRVSLITYTIFIFLNQRKILRFVDPSTIEANIFEGVIYKTRKMTPASILLIIQFPS
jgi:hypothetical protein